MSGTMRSLDERYLEFTAATRSTFGMYPQLEPLRRFVFKDLLIQRRTESLWATAKHWLRPLRRRTRTRHAPRGGVLLWVESGRDVIVDALVPVYAELVRRGESVVLISDGGPAQLPSGALAFEYRAAVRAPRWAGEAWEALSMVEPGLRRGSLRRAFMHACAMLEPLSDELARVLEQVRPRSVVSASEQLRSGAALNVVARRLGVRSLLLQHGIVQPFYTPVLADEMLTWGLSSDDILVALGVSPARVFATGSPRHDAMQPSEKRGARARLVRALGVPDRPTLVFFSNGNDLVRNGPGPAACADWLERAAARTWRDVNLVVRLHPNEDGALYRQCRHVRVTKDSSDFRATLDGCDRVASLCSTVLYDGLLFGKPVWQFYADGWPDLADNWKRGLALRIGSAAQLEDAIRAMSGVDGEPDVDPGLVRRVFANHGRATQVVVDAIIAASRFDAGRQALQPPQLAGATSL